MWPQGNVTAGKPGVDYQREYTHATVVEGGSNQCQFLSDPEVLCQTLKTVLDNGAKADVAMSLSDSRIGIVPGDHIIVASQAGTGDVYYFHALDRAGLLLVVAAVVVLLVVALTGSKGLLALGNLVAAYLFLWAFLLPGINRGGNPVIYAIVSAAVILPLMLFTTHGVSTRTLAALIGTGCSVVAAAGAGWAASVALRLSGHTGDATTMFIYQGFTVDLRLLALAALLISTLGVMNDMTVTQAAIVWELSPDGGHVAKRALRVGRDHAGSAIYTVAFSLVGAGMLAMVVAGIYGAPLWAWLQEETVAQTLVEVAAGIIGIVISAPLTTVVAMALHRREASARSLATGSRNAAK